MKSQYNQNPSTPQNDTGTLLSSNLYYYRNVGANFKDENEFKHRYDNQLQANSSLAKRVKELEVELQSTNTRYDEMKDKLLKEIESEKQLRKETETSSMAQIEKYIKSETELKQQYLDLKNKYYEQAHQLKELQEKYEEVTEKYKIMKDSHSTQVKALEEQMKQKDLLHNSSIQALEKENDKIHNDSNSEMKKILDANTKKMENYEQTIQNLKALKDKYERNNIQLQKEFSELKIEKENEKKEKINQLNDEFSQQKKQLLKEFNDKFVKYDNERDEMVEHYTQLTDGLQKKNVQLSSDKVKLERELTNLQSINKKLSKDNDTMKLQLNSHNVEVTKKEELIAALKAQLDEAKYNIKKHFDETDKEVAHLSSEYNKTRIEWQKEKQELLNQIDNLKYSEKELRDENEKLKKEKTSFKEELKKYINLIVDEKINEIKVI